MVSKVLDPLIPIKWHSAHLAAGTFTPTVIFLSLSQLGAGEKFDFVIISVPNLQSFQSCCAELQSHLHSESVIVVECTGYVHLEPFVLLSLLKFKSLPVCSIMNESDIKQHPRSNTFVHKSSSSDHRIYLGTSTEETKASVPLGDSEPFLRFYRALQTMQDKLEGSLGLLKSINAREFMTYQWKLALPRVVLNPLSVVFEQPYPANLEKQILVKPLISGLVLELFKIIKKMDCKLVKGFENETNILKSWLAIYPPSRGTVQPEHCDSNVTFYNFYHQQDIDLDLLLLQPILLGDDHGIKTPYLENLYSIMCQLSKINTSKLSLFFARKSSGQDGTDMDRLMQEMSKIKLERDSVDKEFSGAKTALKRTELELADQRQKNERLALSLQKREVQNDAQLKELIYKELEKERMIASLDAKISEKAAALNSLTEQVNQATTTAENAKKVLVADEKPADMLPTPDLSEFAEAAAYGEGLINTPTKGTRPSGEGRQLMVNPPAEQVPNEEFSDNYSGSMVGDTNRQFPKNHSVPSMYSGQYDSGYDQRNDYNAQFAPNQRNMHMYLQAGIPQGGIPQGIHQGGVPQGAMPQGGVPTGYPGTASFNTRYPVGMGPPQGMYRQGVPMQQMPGNGQFYAGNAQGQNFHAKKQARRSAFGDQPMLNIDYGGRGGMSMPNNGSKQRGAIGAVHGAIPPAGQRKSYSNGNILGGAGLDNGGMRHMSGHPNSGYK
ncbi:hypothetical protein METBISCDRAFT_23790 [Metschnikowia bicuspidata]|uniref:Ketopantoate reductase C-terminal domain-containing protein n=1 Tax=Metschnikowia bicuspidata TaxID=27322 RepID=A0A4P9ZAP1_9ASCO|nr:hypothetical protein METBISCDRAFT_23790 [Metschnikowia bicuspidata]